MEDLFKIDKIDGKGLGWIALQDIKAGTLIYEEKPQFTVCDDTNLLDLMNSFYAMSENVNLKKLLLVKNKCTIWLETRKLKNHS